MTTIDLSEVVCARAEGRLTTPLKRWTTGDERLRADHLPPRRGAAFLRGRALLRGLVADLVDVDPSDVRLVTHDGRPVAPAFHVGLSVSHTGDVTVAAARHGGRIGVDIIALDTAPGRIPAAARRAEARDAVSASGLDVHPDLLVWGATEAVLKGAGCGLTVPLDALRWDAHGSVVTVEGPDFGRWFVDLTRGANLAVALAVAA
jgi:phosphopantetheinyl transferase